MESSWYYNCVSAITSFCCSTTWTSVSPAVSRIFLRLITFRQANQTIYQTNKRTFAQKYFNRRYKIKIFIKVHFFSFYMCWEGGKKFPGSNADYFLGVINNPPPFSPTASQCFTQPSVILCSVLNMEGIRVGSKFKDK